MTIRKNGSGELAATVQEDGWMLHAYPSAVKEGGVTIVATNCGERRTRFEFDLPATVAAMFLSDAHEVVRSIIAPDLNAIRAKRDEEAA